MLRSFYRAFLERMYIFGQHRADGTGLTYLRARYLHTTIGRFISHDIWEGNYEQPLSFNAWAYVEGNPIRYIDRTGHSKGAPQPPEPPPILFPPGDPCKGHPNEEECKYYVLDNWNMEKRRPPYIRQWYPSSGIPYADLRDFQQKLHKEENYAQGVVSSEWNGLCGLITVAAILDRPVRTLIIDEYYYGINKLDKKYGNPSWVDGAKLRDFINQLYGDEWDASYRNSPTRYDRNPDSILFRTLGSNKFIMPLVEIVSGSSTNPIGGKVGLTSRTYDGCNNSEGSKLCHWVAITGMSLPWHSDDNSPYNWVRIFNPFDNQEEYYRWKDFREAWHAVTNAYSEVVISPDPEGK